MRRIILFKVGALSILLPFQILLWLLILVHSGIAQTHPITPSGLNTTVSDPLTIDGKTRFDITGGTRAGSNLFHSFSDFNVPNKNIANFRNDTGLATDNILGRVSGGNVSSIFGIIQTTGFGDANLFLMNPAGIILGPTASLNVGGSVTFTTADYLRLGENGRFNTVPNTTADALLSSSPIAAYGFLGSNPGAITILGSQLKIPRGADISLVSGDITVQSGMVPGSSIRPARLSTSGGQINLASVASPGELLTNTLEQAPNINDQSFETLGTIHVSGKSVIDSSGDGGGAIFIRAGHFVIDDSQMSANTTGQATRSLSGPIGIGVDIEVDGEAVIRNGSLMETNVSGNVLPNSESGGVHIKANRIEIRGGQGPDGFPTIIQSIRAPNTAVGSGGNIQLQANSILIQENGNLSTETHSAGQAGNIVLAANNNIDLAFSVLFSGALDGATGNAGNIEVASTNGNISTIFSELLSQATFSPGNAGAITVTASRGDIQLDSTRLSNLTFDGGTGGPGNLRSISVTANNLTLINASIEGNNFTSPIQENIHIAAADSLRLTDSSSIQGIARGETPAAELTVAAPNISISGKSFLSTESKGSGAGGPLNIFANDLQLTDGGQIRSGSGIGRDPLTGAPTITSGSGGTVNINNRANPSGSVLIDGTASGIFTDAKGSGASGSIDMSTRSLTIQNGGKITAETAGIASTATGGLITINATDQVILTNSASITARSTGPADAGNISINAGQHLDVMGADASRSVITTEAKQAQGGNINIQAIDRVRVVDGEISTSVLGGAGSGGNITIDPKVVLLQNSDILAQANRGTGGDISITTPVFIADQSSRVDASTPLGLNGRITIQSPTSNLSGTVGQLVSKTTPPQVLLQNRCVALAGGEQSTFLLSGREALPVEPGGWLSSPVSMEHWTGEETAHTARLMVQNRGLNSSPVPAAQKTKPLVPSLRRLTPPGFLVRTFATGATGCPS